MTKFLFQQFIPDLEIYGQYFYTNMEQKTFNGLGISPAILDILQKQKLTVPTPIQHQSIPAALEGKDIIGIAQTGTGKTLAFGIPMIQKLISSFSNGLVILPTRELAIQVNESLTRIGKPLGLQTAILIGGDNMNRQIRQIRNNPHVIIATPGRLADHIQRRTISLANVSVLVLDEADRMLDMGFEPQVRKIMQSVPKKRQTMLFSATMPARIVDIAKAYMQLPIRVEVAPAGSVTENVTHELFFLKRDSKLSLLVTLLEKHVGSTLIFSRTKHGARKIAAKLRKMNYSAAEIHSDRSLRQRLDALNGFKTGKYRVLVATDIAARGIDVTGIELVINYDLPDCAEDYVHRIGRTGRASRFGHAISFATPDQRFDVRLIERLIKKPLPISKLPEHLQKEDDAGIQSAGQNDASRHNFSHSRKRDGNYFSRGAGKRSGNRHKMYRGFNN